MDDFQEYPILGPIIKPVVNFFQYLNAPLMRWLQPANPTPERQQFKHVRAPKYPLSDGSVVSRTYSYSGGPMISKDGIKLVIPEGAIRIRDSVTFFL